MEKLSEADKKRLLLNRFVEKITDSQVSFTPEFKILAVKSYLKGQNPKSIFLEAGIDTSIFKDHFPKKSIARWKTIYLEEGEKGLKHEKRGKKSTGRPKDQKFSSLEAELAYLRLENDFLKKLHALAALKEKKNSR